jgi:DnaJ homolog subfamily C member 3
MRFGALLLPLAASWLPATRADGSGPESGSLYPPGLQPLISRANAYLSAGQFSDAAKAYSDAIGMSSRRLMP